MSQHLDTVQQERAKYGTPLGNANAWAVINATAYTWRAEGWGLLEKTAGNNYNGYSVDVIVNVHELQAVDCLGDAEGEGRPQWAVLPWDDSFAARWRPPVGEDPTPPDPPEPPDDDLQAQLDALGARVAVIEAALKTCGAAMP